jgi:hypothetical protein
MAGDLFQVACPLCSCSSARLLIEQDEDGLAVLRCKCRGHVFGQALPEGVAKVKERAK